MRNVADKLALIAENEPKVYEAGEKAERDAFWSKYQDNGARTDYSYAFYGSYWDDSTFKPKYDFHPTSANYLFSNSRITNLEQILIDQGVELDVSKCGNPASWIVNSSITHLPMLQVKESVVKMTSWFTDASSLVSIRGLKIRGAHFHEPLSDWWESGLEMGVNCFKNCSNLEEIHEITAIEGTDTDYDYYDEEQGNVHATYIGLILKYIDVSQCPKLSRESLLRISEALADYTLRPHLLENYSGTCILGATNLAKLTEEEITAITNKGWVVS